MDMETGIEILDETADELPSNSLSNQKSELSKTMKLEEQEAQTSKELSSPVKCTKIETHNADEVSSPEHVRRHIKLEQGQEIFADMRVYVVKVSTHCKDLLLNGGAIIDETLDDLSTHIVAGKSVDVYHDEAMKALDSVDKPTIFEDWVEMCVKYQTLLPVKAYSVHRKRLFKGMKICLTKLGNKDRMTLYFLITHYGGKCTLRLDRNVTHLITGACDGKKYDKAMKVASIQVVAPDWITDSIKAHKALSPKNFSPNRLVDSVESGYLHAIDSVLTGAILGKTPTLDLSSPEVVSHLSGLVTKSGLGVGAGGRGKQLKDSAGRFKSTGLGVKTSTGMLTKKKLSKNSNKAGGYFGQGGSLLNLQKNYPGGAAASVPLSPPSSIVIPQGSKFYGHDPDQHIPEECCLIACRLLFVDVDSLASHSEIDMWKKVVENYFGIVNSAYNSKLTHILCASQSFKSFKKAIQDGKRLVTPYWLNEVIKRKQNFAPNEAIHFPVSFPPTRSVLQGKTLSCCGFSLEEREKIKMMFHVLGVKYSPPFTQSCFALICKDLNNEKVKKAQEWSIPVYNVDWLSDVIIRGKQAIENSSHAIYQRYDKENPFELDVLSYRELHKFMGAWLKPLKVNSGEIRKKSSYWEYLMLKQKQVSDDPSSSCFKKIRQTTAEGGQNKEYILFPPSRPIDQMPRVVFTGFEPEVLEKLKVKLFSLGGKMATTMSQCTHVCAPKILRTVKFLVGVCTVDQFVTEKWIEDSFEKRWWQKEINYVPTEKNIETTLGFRLLGSLKRAKERKLLHGYRIYFTPGVEPNFATLSLIVEGAGGRMLRMEPESPSNNHCLIISCEKDLPMCAKYKSKNFSIYSVDLILCGALTQDLDFDRFKLEIPAAVTYSISYDSSTVTSSAVTSTPSQPSAEAVSADGLVKNTSSCNSKSTSDTARISPPQVETEDLATPMETSESELNIKKDELDKENVSSAVIESTEGSQSNVPESS